MLFMSKNNKYTQSTRTVPAKYVLDGISALSRSSENCHNNWQEALSSIHWKETGMLDVLQFIEILHIIIA